MRIALSWIDLKLALRMLFRYPGLTLVGALGMAVAICVSVAAFTISWKLLDPVLPLEDGDRVVGILNWDARTNNRELRSLHDYTTWKDELRSVEDTGAVIGVIGAIGLEALLEGEMFQGKGAIVLPLVAVCTTVVGLLAAWGPAREGLRIQPTEALREE